MQRPTPRLAPLCAALIAASAFAITVRFNTFTAWGTDSAAYIAAGHRWATGELFTPATLVFWAPWSRDGRIEAPLGHRPGPTNGTIVSDYPLGYPLLLAAAIRMGGDLAPYVVAPLFAGVLSWCAYLLAAQLSSRWAGVAASGLVAASPITLGNAIEPMSDVPAAALWALAWVLSLRASGFSAIAAGSVTAAAIMVRPNLAPLASVIAAVVFVQPCGVPARRWARLFAFGGFAAIGPALLLWSQAVLYGDPLAPPYGNPATFFSMSRIPANLWLYPSLLMELHTVLPLAGLALVPLAVRRAGLSEADRRAAVIAVSALGIVIVNYALYLPFLTYQGWVWLRFMLPALTALFMLFAALVDRGRITLMERSRRLSLVMIAPIVLVAAYPRDEIRALPAPAAAFRRVQLMGHYLREAAPPNAAIISFLQGGAVQHYTGRLVVRLDLIAAGQLDSIIEDLRKHRYEPVMLIDEVLEDRGFRDRFTGSLYQNLDWPPRAEFRSPTAIWYMDPADRERYRARERWPIDVLR